MRYQHSFWYGAAREIFQEAARADAACGIAYWGIALSLLSNPHGPIPTPDLPTALRRSRRRKPSAPRPSVNATTSTR